MNESGAPAREPALAWSELYGARRAVRDRFGSIWDVPIAKRYNRVLASLGRDGMRILEIGAGDRGLKHSLERRWPASVYRSMDIDTSHAHDFHSLEAIEGHYDLVCLFELIEHVAPAAALAILKRCHEVLDHGGLVMITTPNVYYPPNFLRDATHVTPWCYDELGGMATLAGFEVERLYRLYNDSLAGKLVHRVLFYPLHRILGIDFAKQVMLVGRRP